MSFLIRTASLSVVLSASLVMAGPAQADEPCVSGAEVRAQVQELVASLRDDVKSAEARKAIRAALIETMRTYRGEHAETPAERRALGQEIAALAKRQSDAETRVEGRALSLEIRALIEQRERGSFTEAEQGKMASAEAKLRRAAVARTSNKAEGQEVAAAFKALHEQFACTPA